MEFETVLRSDLSQPVKVQQLTGNLFSGDNKANKITVEVYNNGEPVTLSGGVTGYVIREDQKTVVISDSQGSSYTSLDGNKASVILPQSAYVKEGQVSIVVKVGTVTVGACTTYVYKSTTTQQIDPGSVVPDISTLMGYISDCIAATEDANDAAQAANDAADEAVSIAEDAVADLAEIVAPLFAVGDANDPKTYVTNEGKLYYLPNGHEATVTWANTTKLEVKVADVFDIIDQQYGVQDGRTNELLGLTDYGYDTSFSYPPGATTGTNVYEKRNKTIIQINGNPTGDYHFVKLNNEPARTASPNVLKGWGTPSYFTTGHVYRITLTRLSGTCVNSSDEQIAPVVYAYRQGESSSASTIVIEETDKMVCEFTAEEGVAYQIVLTRIINRTFTNYICSVVMQDMGDSSVLDLKKTKASVIEQTKNDPAASVSFSDGAVGFPMKASVSIDSTQNTNGYDFPWVGGNGKNLLNAKTYDETISGVTFKQNGSGMVDCSNTTTSACWYRIDQGAVDPNKALILPSGTYIFSATGLITNTYIRVTDSTGTEKDVTPTTAEQTITSDGSTAIVVNMRVQSGVAFGDSTKIYCMIRDALDDDDTWKPYSNICPIVGNTGTSITLTNGETTNTFNVTFSSITDSETIYGGILTVNDDGTGKLEITHLLSNLYTWSWSYSSSYGFRAGTSSTTAGSKIKRRAGGQSGESHVFCSNYKITNVTSAASFKALNGVISIGNSSISTYQFLISDKRFGTDATAFRTALENEGTQLVYELSDDAKANYIYYFTAEQMKILLGTNTISGNTGNVLSVTYPADTKTYIDDRNADRMIASNESSMVATRNYTAGELFTVGNTLYKATSNIENTGTIVPGTGGNCTETTVAAEIWAILNSSATGVSF